MRTKSRPAEAKDRNTYIDFTLQLSKFNRRQHHESCKYDDYNKVLQAIKEMAEDRFDNQSEDSLILIAELDNEPVGYALGRIYQEDKTLDNGTGLIGLFDELFIDKKARGFGLGQKLIDGILNWMKKQDVNRVKLHAYSWNDKAKRIYESKGFKEYAVSYEKFI